MRVGAEAQAGDLPRAELAELRRRLLPAYMAGLIMVFAIWGSIFAWRSRAVPAVDAAVAVAGLASVVAFLLRRRHYTTASYVFVLGLTLSAALLVLAVPHGLTIAFGSLPLIIAYALLGARQALLVGLLSWAAGAAAYHLARGSSPANAEVMAAAILYALIWGATAVAGQPLRASVEIALEGWSQSRTALREARERRGELNHVLRALEEATYRIERMNNELMLARQAAEAARANKARFAAMVSHELRGPLNLILGFSRLMALSPENYGAPLPDVYRADVDTIYENSQHVVSLLDDVLDLSQVEVDRMPLARDRIDIEQDVIADVVNIVRPLIARRHLYLHREAAAELPTTFADKVRLRQVLLNLLTNAVRFTDRGGITLRSSICPEGILISVADTGRGIAADQLPRLFEEFQQLQQAESLGWKGTGLGLAISKHIVELHGGRISAESTPGAGTTFHLTLPVTFQPCNAPRGRGGSRSSRRREWA